MNRKLPVLYQKISRTEGHKKINIFSLWIDMDFECEYAFKMELFKSGKSILILIFFKRCIIN